MRTVLIRLLSHRPSWRWTRAHTPLRQAHSSSRRARVAPIARPSRNAPAPTVYVDTGLRIALVGRPNVGKSTLFNQLASAVRGRGTDGVSNPAPLVFVRSVVHALPGVTRDPREASAAISDLRFTVTDTAGLEDAVSEALERKAEPRADGEVTLVAATAMTDTPVYRNLYRKMEAGTAAEVRDADVVFFMFDAAHGLTQVDRAIALWLRKEASEKDIVVVANKCDVAGAENNAIEAYELGFGDPVVLSAEHKLGLADLYTEINRVYMNRGKQGNAAPAQLVDAEGTERTENDELRESFDDELVLGYGQKVGEEPLRQLIVSIIGRPNVGKSTLLNRLVGEEKSIAGPVAGITRDSVLCEWKLPENISRPDDVPVWLVDTAGIRARVKVETENLERSSVRSSLRALRHSHVVLIVLDSTNPLAHQDMKLIDVAITEGRAVVIVVNKMDKLHVDNMDSWRESLRYAIDSKVHALQGVEVVEISAKDWSDGDAQMRRLFWAVQKSRERWEKRVPTSALNRFVANFNERLSVGGRIDGEKRNRIGVTKFISQKKIRPPMFRLDGSSAVSMNYLRSLTNAIRKEFGFEGVPIRVKRPSRRKRK
ncbi:unnamed protein product [Chondrus crispus]|uniref:GTPase Der n=1 Tax=Chondrus crispus TaxID=2769 RepID=R7QJ22_CHOCR|nr:unnamed protein product [Chondrus crispus]CDF37768.1 unnamed protein product [Chondrus crispus]|eukprot:XP_005717639.1 unnamed protein product [Chondrus crispus]